MCEDEIPRPFDIHTRREARRSVYAIDSRLLSRSAHSPRENGRDVIGGAAYLKMLIRRFAAEGVAVIRQFGLHAPRATAGTNFSIPFGGNASVFPCSAL